MKQPALYFFGVFSTFLLVTFISSAPVELHSVYFIELVLFSGNHEKIKSMIIIAIFFTLQYSRLILEFNSLAKRVCLATMLVIFYISLSYGWHLATVSILYATLPIVLMKLSML